MKRLFTIFLITVLFVACTSFDVEKRVRNTGSGSVKSSAPSVVAVPVDAPEVRVIEKPVYMPPEESSNKKAASGTDAVKNSNTEGILKPSDYSRAAMIYDYHTDWVYEVYTQPFRVSDVQLMAGEKVAEAPFISDSERWMLGAGVSYDNGTAVQHIYIKPVQSGLEASLIINTDRRVYHLILRSYQSVHMPKVRWRYPETAMPKNFARAQTEDTTNDAIGIDPRFLSFNYKITHALFGKPRWLPELAYDDGKKTYITFPEGTLQGEMPAVFEERNNMLNYRVARNVIIIDKLVEKITIKIGNKSVIVEKKKR
jgi:type IV secretion system protein VirB9